ncbi:MAG: putative RNA-binding protein with PUA-like domain [Paraglaciecola sp.]|jgi:predicted RNA-binding protein with PUA-like domain
MNYWLFKTEPDTFSIDDLGARTEQTEHWDGIRNYQARNFLRDQVKLGDKVFIYHSSCKDVGIAGLAEVGKEAYPDHTQFDPLSRYYDPKSPPENPRWFMVDVQFVEKFSCVLSLKKIKSMPDIIEIGLVKKGHRLSIIPVTESEFSILLQAAKGQSILQISKA